MWLPKSYFSNKRDWKQGFGQDGKINKNVIMKARIGKKRSVNVLFYWLEYKIYIRTKYQPEINGQISFIRIEKVII